MKRGKKLLILVLALAIALAGYYLAVKLGEKESAKKTDQEVKLVASDVTGLKWEHDGESLVLTSANGVWTLNGSEDCPVDQETASNMAKTLSDYTAKASIEGNITPADYGLETPSYEATVTTADGDITFKQGDGNSLTGQTYLSKSTDGNTVYAVDESLEDLFAVSAIDLVAFEPIPAIGDANKLSIDGSVELTKDENGEWRGMTGEKASETKVEALFDAIREIKWSKLVDWTGNTALENPKSIVCSWDDGKFEVAIGQKTDDGYLAGLPNSKLVYAIDAANAEVILAANDESLRSTELFDVNWDEDYTITASVGGVEYAPGEEAASVLKDINTSELAQPSGEELLTVTVNGVICVIRDYDRDNCTATINGITRFIPAQDADKLQRTIKYS